MAGYSNRIRTLYYDDTGQVAGADKTFEYTGGAQLKWNETVTGGSNIVVTAAIDVSAVIAVLLLSPRAMTVTINDDGSPDATISLLANVPKMWSADVGGSNPLGAVDVTSWKAALAAGADAVLTFIVLLDPTP